MDDVGILDYGNGVLEAKYTSTRCASGRWEDRAGGSSRKKSVARGVPAS